MKPISNCSEWMSTGSNLVISTNAKSDAFQYVYPVQTASVSYCTDYKYAYQYQNIQTLTTSGNESINWYSGMLSGSSLYGSIGGGIFNIGGLGCQPLETAEEKTARLKQEVEREEKRKAASMRAEHLLFTILTKSQAKTYVGDSYFEVAIDNRTYRIKKGYSRNIELIEAGKPVALYCIHPENARAVPAPDAMLAQLLMLKNNEAEFLKLANRTAIQ